MAKPRLHPYSSQPSQAFWSRAVARDWNARDLVVQSTPLLRHDDQIASAGSCFAANIVPFFETVGYEYVRTEVLEADERFGYSLYSAAYGNIYTARQMRQLLLRALQRFTPIEDRWYESGTVVDAFRPGMSEASETNDEFDLVTRSHLSRVRAAVEQASVLIFTLGLTEAWVSCLDGAVYPACPGTIAGVFDSNRHQFHSFTVQETLDDLSSAIELLREINPHLRVILTVSPVPLVATATDQHVYRATTYSKANLRVACEEVSRIFPDVAYFPAFEIVTGPHSDGFFESDYRTVSQSGIQAVMDVLFHSSELPKSTDPEKLSLRERIKQGETLSRKLSERECEEVANDAEFVRFSNQSGG